ncbi:HipA family kinase [Thiorhodococcus fuscus]|uniref:HipA family kinase n=1 Tax=Thiorhodococcus fuscus TaxID=527200 RepID=A0ABW4YB21_9GAMM
MITPRPVKDLGNVSELWHGDVLTHAGDIRVYLKRATNEEILSECLCAVIGRALELPIPRAYLVHDPQRLLGGGILIGSEDAGMRSWKHFIDAAYLTAINGLSDWPMLHDVAVFDEWIANPDRNTGNILWDQVTGWALIDHARSLGAWPPSRPVPPPSAEVRNLLAEIIHQLPGELEPKRLEKLAQTRSQSYRRIDSQKAHEASRCAMIGMAERAREALSFLGARATLLPSLMERHNPQTSLKL